MNLTTIEHFVTFKGRDACDIIMKKIATHHSTNTGAVPISTYHVEYEPQLIVRGTTTYAKNARKRKINSFAKIIINKFEILQNKNAC